MPTFVIATLVLGSLLGIWLSGPAILSGKMALGYSLLPFVGFGLGLVFC